MAIPQINPYDYFYQWRDKTNLLATTLGDLTQINVASGDRDTFVEAINKSLSNIGSLISLTTTEKSSLVGAVNEHQTKIGTASLTTTAQTLLAAVNELDSEHGVLSSLTTSNQSSLVGAINELNSSLGTLDSLNTTNKTNLVAAVSEVQTELGSITSLTTTLKTSAVSAINELDGEMGILSQLLTTEKNTIVGGLNEVFNMHLITNVTITIGTENTDVIRVTVQLKDGTGANLAFRANVFIYLSDQSDGSSLMSVEHSGGWVIGTEGLLIPQISNKTARVTTNGTGLFNIDITESGTKTAYLVVVLPNGKNIVSTAITHAA